MTETYDDVPPGMWDGLAEMDDYNIKHILSLFALIGIPESYLDLGCGTGIMVEMAQKLGVRAYGVDQLVDKDDPREGFYHANLVNKFILKRAGAYPISGWNGTDEKAATMSV